MGEQCLSTMTTAALNLQAFSKPCEWGKKQLHRVLNTLNHPLQTLHLQGGGKGEIEVLRIWLEFSNFVLIINTRIQRSRERLRWSKIRKIGQGKQHRPLAGRSGSNMHLEKTRGVKYGGIEPGSANRFPMCNAELIIDPEHDNGS